MVQLADLDQRAERWASIPEFTTLGVDTLQLGSGESFFARFLADGSLVVANGSAIMRLGRDGAFEDVLARSGDGPGEFRVILGLGTADDGSLFASDHLSGRLTQLQPGGAVVRTIARLRPFAADAQAFPFAVLSDGRVLAVPWQWQAARDPLPDASRAVVRDQVPIVVYGGEGEVLDTIALLPGLERSEGFVAPFARSAVYGSRGGRRWVAGISDSLDLTLYDATDSRLRLVAQKVPGAISDRQRHQRDSAVAAKFGGNIGAAVVRRQASMSKPASTPDIGGVLVDDVGRIWVGAYVVPGEPERTWFIFSEEGDPVGQLTLPAFGGPLLPLRTELLDVSGERIAIIRERDDEAYIEVRRLEMK